MTDAGPTSTARPARRRSRPLVPCAVDSRRTSSSALHDTPHYLTEAEYIVEVLSPSTTATDRREKRIAYCSLPSLRHYLVVDAEDDVIEHHRRLDAETFDLLVLHPGDVIELACTAGATLDVAGLLAR